MSVTSSLQGYHGSTTASLPDIPSSFLSSTERSLKISQRLLRNNLPNDGTEQSRNSKNQECNTQEIQNSWQAFYIQANQERPQEQINLSSTTFEKNSDNSSLFIPGSPLEIRETTIDVLLGSEANDRDTVFMLTPFERIAIANQILLQQGENAENLLFYESFYSAMASGRKDLDQSHNKLYRITTYLDRIKTAFSPEISSPTNLWIQARTDAILSNANIDYFDACEPCQKVFKIKNFTAVFKDYDLRSRGSPLPCLKACLNFSRYPRICRMYSGRSFLILPNGELVDYDALREKDRNHPLFWNHLAFALKILPILPRQVMQAQEGEGKVYGFLRWEPEIHKEIRDRRPIKDYIKKGIETYRENGSAVRKAAADLIFPQTEADLKNSEEGTALAFFLYVAGIPWEDKNKAAIFEGMEVTKTYNGTEKWREGMEAVLSNLPDINQTATTRNLMQFSSLPTAHKILDTAKRTKVGGFRRLVQEMRRITGELFPGREQTISRTTIVDLPPPLLPQSISLINSTDSVQETTGVTSISSTTTVMSPTLETGLAADVSSATMIRLLDLGENITESPRTLLAARNSFVNSVRSPLEYERAKTFIDLEISNWATQTNRGNLTRSEIITDYFAWQKTNSASSLKLTFPDLIQKDLLEASSDSFKTNITVKAEALTVPNFKAENIISVLNEEEINLRLDVQRMAGDFLQTESIRLSSNHTSERSLFTICGEAVRLLAGDMGNRLTVSQAVSIRNEILNKSNDLYSPSSATALLHLESQVWAVESDNAHLSDLQRSHAYLDRLYNNDPFQPITNTSDVIDGKADLDPDLAVFEKGSLHSARAHAFQKLLGKEARGLSQMDMINKASELLNPETEGYEAALAREFINLEAKVWAEEALFGDLTEEEIFNAYLHRTSYLANPPNIPEFRSRREIAEEYVREHYSGERYYESCSLYGSYGKTMACRMADRVNDVLDWGGVNGVDSGYNSQLNSLFNEGSNSVIAVLAQESFKKTELAYSELIRSSRRIWIIENFAPVYRKRFAGRYLNKSAINFRVPKTGFNIYSGDPILFETEKGRFAIVLPNGEVSVFARSPLTSTGEVSHRSIAVALGIGNLDGLPHTETYPNGVSVKWPFQGWTMSVEYGSTLVPPQTLIEKNIRAKLKNEIGNLEKAHYSPTGFQSFFFATVPFLQLILDNANGAHSEFDVADFMFEVFDLSITLLSLGIPLTKSISGAAKAVRAAAKGLVGTAKTQMAIRAFFLYMAKTKYTRKMVQEATDFFIPIFTARDLLRLQVVGSKKLIRLVHKKSNALLTVRGLSDIRAAHIICRRSPTLACSPAKSNLMEQLATSLSETEEPVRDALFEQIRKSFVQPLRTQLKQQSSEHIKTLRKNLDKVKKSHEQPTIKTAYEALGRALLQEEKTIFAEAEKVFKETLDNEFDKIIKTNPSAKRQDYIVNLPKVKLELDVTTKSIQGARPVIRLIGEGEKHGAFFLRFIQSVIAKDISDYRIFYKVEFGELKGLLKYGIEKPGYRGTDSPLVYVGSPAKALKYADITKFLFSQLKRTFRNNERELVKLIRIFSDTGHLPGKFRNLVIHSDLEEKLSALALICHISEEARTPGTGTVVERLLQELYSPGPHSFLDVMENGTPHRLTFREIFDTRVPLLSFMSPKSKNTGANVWRTKHFKNSKERIKMNLEKRKFDPDPDNLSADERQMAMGLNPNSMTFQSPLKSPKFDPDKSVDSIDSSRKKRFAEFNSLKMPASIEEGKGPSWKKVAAIAIPVILYMGPPAMAVTIPIAIYGAIQWLKKSPGRAESSTHSNL